jgi:DNA-binding XRE family transcriptional regulator
MSATNSAVSHALLGLQYGTDGGHLDPIWVQLREHRVAAGLTIADLSALAGVASSTISRGERGYHSWLEITRKVAAALDLEIGLGDAA